MHIAILSNTVSLTLKRIAGHFGQNNMAEGAAAEGILLYYAYRDLTEPGIREEACQWYTRECEQLVGTASPADPSPAPRPGCAVLTAALPRSAQGLVGRVRVALDGLNATLGGSMAALRRHIAAVDARFAPGGAPIDFKLAESGGRRNAAVMQQSVGSVACARV